MGRSQKRAASKLSRAALEAAAIVSFLGGCRPPRNDIQLDPWKMPAKILIIAYGNPLRCDDGIAWRAADALAQKLSDSDVEIVRLHQLAPELAETISHFKW